MHTSRRALIGGALASGAALTIPGAIGAAQEASPETGRAVTPGYGIARVRTHATPETLDAVYADVLSRFLPATRETDGYAGYLFAFDGEDPTAAITLTLLADAAAAEAAAAIAMQFVDGMDPRLRPETPIAEQGEVRIFQTTDRPAADLPPLLNGCHITMRYRLNAADTDIEGVIAAAADGFVPIIRDMPGYVLYAWMYAEGGRISFNIWETAEQLAAGNEAVADFAAANPVITEERPATVHEGVIGYSDFFGRN